MKTTKAKSISVDWLSMLGYCNGINDLLHQYARVSTNEKKKDKKNKPRKKYVDRRNWKETNAKLIKRGEFYINPIFLETWLIEIKEVNLNKIGQPFLYPPSMIKFLAILHVKGFDCRSLEGIMHALSKRLGNFPVISFSQVRRRILDLDIGFKVKEGNSIVGIDGSGIKVSNRGE